MQNQSWCLMKRASIEQHGVNRLMITLPLKILERVRKSDGKEFWFIPNLNSYTQAAKCTYRRNALKQEFSNLISSLVSHLKPIEGKISLKYTLHPGDKRTRDLSNVCCIIDKYFSDVLSKEGIIEDDNYNFIPRVEYVFGNIDKDNPRCEVTITRLGE